MVRSPGPDLEGLFTGGEVVVPRLPVGRQLRHAALASDHMVGGFVWFVKTQIGNWNALSSASVWRRGADGLHHQMQGASHR